MGSSTEQYGVKGQVVRSRAITDADTNTTAVVLDIPANTFIPPFGVTIVILTAFAGGTPSLDVGDSAAADGWIDTTEITEVTPGTYSGVAAAFAVTGKYYAAADAIEVVVATGLTAGKAYILAHLIDVEDIIDD
jgi:hypothetical protein